MLKIISRYFESVIEIAAIILLISCIISGFSVNGILGAIIGALFGFIIDIIVFGLVVQVVDIKIQLKILNENLSKILDEKNN